LPFGPNVASKNIKSTIVATIANPFLPEDSIGGFASIDPEGLYAVLQSLNKYNKPVFIMENGIDTIIR